MAVTLPSGPRSWGPASTDERGYRQYQVVYRLGCDPLDGPSVITAAMATLVPVGTPWVIGNEVDPWCWRRPEIDISPVQEGEPNEWFDVTLTFSNRPVDQDSFSSDPGSTPSGWSGGTPTTPAGGGVEDPLLVPDRISGGSTKYTEEASTDLAGDPILNSAFEPIKGAPVEFDKSRATVRVEQNRSTLGLATLTNLVNCVNSSTLWGYAARTVKFNNFTWEKKYYAGTNVYYTRTLEFEIRDETFDRYILDEGSKVVSGHWDGDEWVLDNVGVLGNPLKPNAVEQSIAPDPNDGLPAGTYLYRVSALDGEGNETLPSPPATITLPDDGAIVLINWQKVTGASAYNLYRTSAEGALTGTYVLTQTTSQNYTDDGGSGTVADLPTANATGTAPDANNPKHFRRYVDKNGNISRGVLDGAGKPAEDIVAFGEDATGYIFVQYYPGKSFADLDLPASL